MNEYIDFPSNSLQSPTQSLAETDSYLFALKSPLDFIQDNVMFTSLLMVNNQMGQICQTYRAQQGVCTGRKNHFLDMLLLPVILNREQLFLTVCCHVTCIGTL